MLEKSFLLITMKKILFLFLLLISLPSFARGPLQRGRFMCGPNVEFTDNPYAAVINFGSGLVTSGVDALTGSSWISRYLIPSTAGTRFLVNRDIVTPAGEAEVKWWDWKLRNHVIGYAFEFQPTISHLGFQFELDYERQSRTAKLPGMEDFMEFSKKMITPGLSIQYQLFDFIDRSWSLNLVVGTKYNYVFKCSGLSEDVNSINNGFTGSVGLGVSFLPTDLDLDSEFDATSLSKTTYFQFRINYNRDLFNYFNPEFVDDAGMRPYEGWTSKYGYLTFNVVVFM